MGVKTVFTDENNNEMELYINDTGNLYINVGQNKDEVYYNGFITLDKSEVSILIKKLQEIEKEMGN